MTRRPTKVALLGRAPTLQHAPWDDPSWAIWAHNSIPLNEVRRVDRWFDLHPPHCFHETFKCGRRYWEWLQRLRTPIYMQEKYPEVPASVRYPRERIQTEFPDIPFGSQTAWMIALALTEGIETIGLFGIHYQHATERWEQRVNAELWCGIAVGRGVRMAVAPGSPMMRLPADLYGYESHTMEKYTARKLALQKAKTEVKGRPPFDPSRLVPRPKEMGYQHAVQYAEDIQREQMIHDEAAQEECAVGR
jgi:hypothetical protein